MILETVVARVRVGCDAVRWQGLAQACPAPCLGLTLRAHAREEEQRGQRAAARLNRARSAVTLQVMVLVNAGACINALFPAKASGQLRFLG